MCIYVHTCVRTHVHSYVLKYVRMYVCMYVRMYVCIFFICGLLPAPLLTIIILQAECLFVRCYY
jgi:hypothetical protein